jgi:hypothetical protein
MVDVLRSIRQWITSLTETVGIDKEEERRHARYRYLAALKPNRSCASRYDMKLDLHVGQSSHAQQASLRHHKTSPYTPLSPSQDKSNNSTHLHFIHSYHTYKILLLPIPPQHYHITTRCRIMQPHTKVEEEKSVQKCPPASSPKRTRKSLDVWDGCDLKE